MAVGVSLGSRFLVDYGYKKRQMRRDVNQQIGAVFFHTGKDTFRVFHNHFAEKIRRIDRRILLCLRMSIVSSSMTVSAPNLSD